MSAGAKKVDVASLPESLQPLFCQDELLEIKEIFDGFDTNGSSDLDALELQIALQVLDVEIEDDEVDRLMEEVDADHDERISFNEFVAICAKARFPQLGSTSLGTLLRGKTTIGEPPKALLKFLSKSELKETKEIFSGFDKNGNGVLDELEVQVALQVLGVDAESSRVSALIKDVDKNGDAVVNFAEFVAMVAVSRDTTGSLGRSELGDLLQLSSPRDGAGRVTKTPQNESSATRPAQNGSSAKTSPAGRDAVSAADLNLSALCSGTVLGVPGGSYRQYRHLRHVLPDGVGGGGVGGGSRQLLTLDRALQHPDALRAFHTFCHGIYAEESLLFWLEAETFQNAEWKPCSVLGLNIWDDLGGERESASSRGMSDSFRQNPKTRSARSALLASTLPAARLREERRRRDKELLRESTRLFKEYLSNDAPTQICLPSHIADAIESLIFKGEASRAMYRLAQRHVFRDMEKGLWKEFLRSRTQEQLVWLASHRLKRFALCVRKKVQRGAVLFC